MSSLVRSMIAGAMLGAAIGFFAVILIRYESSPKAALTVVEKTPVVGYVLICSDGSTQYALAHADDVADWPPSEVCQ